MGPHPSVPLGSTVLPFGRRALLITVTDGCIAIEHPKLDLINDLSSVPILIPSASSPRLFLSSLIAQPTVETKRWFAKNVVRYTTVMAALPKRYSCATAEVLAHKRSLDHLR